MVDARGRVQGVKPVTIGVVLQGDLPTAGQLRGGPDSGEGVGGVLHFDPFNGDGVGVCQYLPGWEVASAELLDQVSAL